MQRPIVDIVLNLNNQSAAGAGALGIKRGKSRKI